MRFRIVALRRAERDFRDIVRWLAGRSLAGASAWVRAYDKLLLRLEGNADTFPLAEESELFNYEIREAVLKTRRGLPYRLVFTIVGDQVRLLRVRGPGQSDLTPDDVDPDP